MPALSPTMEEGTLAKWLVKEGDTVAAGDVIAEIETDKATMEVEAVDEGRVGRIIVDEGTEGVAVNAVIALLLTEDEDESALETARGKQESSAPRDAADNAQAASSAEPDQDRTDRDAPRPAAEKTQTTNGSAATRSGPDGDRVFASPLARRLASEAGLDLGQISGSGPHGRIIKVDVENARKQGSATATATAEGARPAAAQPMAGIDARAQADALGQAYEPVANNNVRKTIARRLLQASQTVPEFFLTIECRIDTLLAARKALNETTKISVNDLVIKASAMALRAHPEINAAWSEDAVLRFTDVDISMAVATDQGLITPIIRNADQKGLTQIAKEARDLAGRARDGKLKPAEYQGGSFSISNLGMFGISEFTAILNPPQACILAVGAGIKRAVVEEDGSIVPATMMNLTLTCDHRVVDGAVGAQFLQTLKRHLEEPLTLLL